VTVDGIGEWATGTTGRAPSAGLALSAQAVAPLVLYPFA
jgi:hypothetical protein